MLGKFSNPLTGHSLLANAGVFAVTLDILAGLGLGMWFQVPFVSIKGVLPFLIHGIGLDGIFILADYLDRQPHDLATTEKIKGEMRHTGATVTMTTIADLVAFAVSTSASFPAISPSSERIEDFLMVVTFFVAKMTYDVRRIKSGRRDCLPCCLAPRTKDGEPALDEPITQTSSRVTKAWGKFLMLPETKIEATIISLVLIGAGIYGVTHVDEAFNRKT
ncbi:Protein patched-like 1 [Stylophora pistillata]|uniref:Protein patched-like 1 n=1 Tax=Stylophora pistillata TaxID=50429 RepID=A0A2B4R9A0_STYPI|nr:Protein patched-like 1 [Stylophora pistillata]